MGIRIRPALVASALALAAAASAQPDWSVAVGYASLEIDGDSGSLAGFPWGTDDSSTGVSLSISRRLWGPLAVEFGIQDFGESTQTVIDADLTPANWPFDPAACPSVNCTVNGNLDAPTQHSRRHLALRADFRPSQRVELMVKAGFAQHEAVSGVDPDQSTLYGIGLAYRFTDRLAITLEHERWTIDNPIPGPNDYYGATLDLAENSAQLRFSF